MRILFATPELEPVSKVGGLGDVSASLPGALARLGHEVWRITPLYRTAEAESLRLEPTGIGFSLRLDGAERRIRLLQAPVRGVTTFFVDCPDAFGRPGVYGENGRDYEDNPARFALFSRAVSPALRRLGLRPDVLHVHDWQCALVPVYRRHVDEAPQDAAPVVLTIHNLVHQGVVPREWLGRLELPEALFTIEGLEFHGQLSFLKGGLVTASAITTVSPRYAEEIRTEEQGAGLEGVIDSRADRLTGILNGIDRDLWNPATDGALETHFHARRPEGKRAVKRALQAELGLQVSADTPLLAAIGRLDRQKGFDLLHEAAPSVLGRGAQLVVLGSGDESMLDRFRVLRRSRAGVLSVERGFQDELGRQIYAGADAFLMPSRYEPCGLGQMIALRYGTIPIVRATGGLADTIRDVDSDRRRGNGFVFDEIQSEALVGAVGRAVRCYRDPARWRPLVRRALRQDFSWDASARRYEDVYRSVL